MKKMTEYALTVFLIRPRVEYVGMPKCVDAFCGYDLYFRIGGLKG